MSSVNPTPTTAIRAKQLSRNVLKGRELGTAPAPRDRERFSHQRWITFDEECSELWISIQQRLKDEAPVTGSPEKAAAAQMLLLHLSPIRSLQMHPASLNWTA